MPIIEQPRWMRLGWNWWVVMAASFGEFEAMEFGIEWYACFAGCALVCLIEGVEGRFFCDSIDFVREG